ncbi:MAG: hypothetical protein ACREEE_16500 [Dongiaceae bacterium]
MTAALIGHTGFVGGNLATARRFDEHYNSQNFRGMANRNFELVVCAGLSAAKWLANRDPAADWTAIADLAGVLQRVGADRFVLISTIDVYPDPIGVDESSRIDETASHAYGRHRHRFEQFVTGHFPRVHVVRLPALFGPGLKKNVLFDLLHDKMLDAINPESRFQWYDIAGLWRDVERVMANGISLINLVNEPIAMHQILGRFFPGGQVGSGTAPVRYDVQTLHAELFGGRARYIQEAADVLNQIGAFVSTMRAEGSA